MLETPEHRIHGSSRTEPAGDAASRGRSLVRQRGQDGLIERKKGLHHGMLAAAISRSPLRDRLALRTISVAHLRLP